MRTIINLDVMMANRKTKEKVSIVKYYNVSFVL